MNDRYLYRAKLKNWRELPKEKWWVEGFYAYMKPYHYIMPKGNYDSWIEIDEKTLCQCTGLKDKNGKLIWENDILKYEWDGEERIDVIKYEAPIFTYSKSMRWSLYKDEVIGNIFDNQELLEVGE